MRFRRWIIYHLLCGLSSRRSTTLRCIRQTFSGMLFGPVRMLWVFLMVWRKVCSMVWNLLPVTRSGGRYGLPVVAFVLCESFSGLLLIPIWFCCFPSMVRVRKVKVSRFIVSVPLQFFFTSSVVDCSLFDCCFPCIVRKPGVEHFHGKSSFSLQRCSSG